MTLEVKSYTPVIFQPPPTKENGLPYTRCLTALYEILTDTDKKKVYIKDSKGIVKKRLSEDELKPIVATRILLQFFTYIGMEESDSLRVHEDGMENCTTKCVCGKDILYIHKYHYNDNIYHIGSECHSNWNQQTIKETQVQQNQGCKYCLRLWKDKGDCKNCKGKKEMYKLLQGWKQYVDLQYRFTFGKYEGKTISTVSRINPKYIDWIVKVQNPSGPLKEAQSQIKVK